MKKPRLLIAAGLVCLIGLAAFFAITRFTGDDADPADTRENPRRRAPGQPESRTRDDSVSRSPDLAGSESKAGTARSLLAGAVIGLRNSAGDPAAARDLLGRLRANLSALSEETAAAGIVDFLKSGDDAPTGLPFVVGAEGVMEAVPSLRTALLDLLPSLDPEAALENARAVIARRDSPDEYALALRNLAWNDLRGDLRAELATGFNRMLAVDAWRARPSGGFLEAFDIAVELADPPRFEALTSVTRDAISSGNEPLGRAAFIALDRMTLRNPDLLTDTLVRQPGWMSFAPSQRASLVSRLDLTRPGDSDAFVAYLNFPDLTGDELAYFARLFPNGNYLAGHRLVTSEEDSLSIEERVRKDGQIRQSFEALVPRIPSGRATTVNSIRERLKRLAAP